MQFHQLQSPKHKKAKRIGRGGKRGTYSGRGIKGQHARAGAKIRPEIRDVIKKIPKKRGYRLTPILKKRTTVALNVVDKIMKEGETVTPKILVERGIVKAKGNAIPEVKLLGSGEITKKLLVKDCQISKGARKAIEAAGGKIE